MRRIAKHRARLYYIGAVLFLLIFIYAMAPVFLRGLFPMPHFDIVQKYAEENKLKITMVYAMMKAESGFREEVMSPKEARGLMQITEKTGNWIAYKLEEDDFSPEDLMDPEMNVRFGCWYFSYLLERFEGNNELALAAYNAGEGTVSGWIQSGEIVWEGPQIESLPYRETEKYLVRVNRIYFVYKTLYPDLDS